MTGQCGTTLSHRYDRTVWHNLQCNDREDRSELELMAEPRVHGKRDKRSEHRRDSEERCVDSLHHLSQTDVPRLEPPLRVNLEQRSLWLCTIRTGV
jgi:hypothetical protein